MAKKKVEVISEAKVTTEFEVASEIENLVSNEGLDLNENGDSGEDLELNGNLYLNENLESSQNIEGVNGMMGMDFMTSDYMIDDTDSGMESGDMTVEVFDDADFADDTSDVGNSNNNPDDDDYTGLADDVSTDALTDLTSIEDTSAPKELAPAPKTRKSRTKATTSATSQEVVVDDKEQAGQASTDGIADHELTNNTNADAEQTDPDPNHTLPIEPNQAPTVPPIGDDPTITQDTPDHTTDNQSNTIHDSPTHIETDNPSDPNTTRTSGLDTTNDSSSSPTPPPAQSRPQPTPQPRPPQASVLTLEVGGEIVTQRDKEDAIWHEIKNSQVSGSHLTGTLGKVEHLENGNIIAIIDYRGQRIAIPLKEMMIVLNRPEEQSDAVYNERVSRILNRMMGAEIDFIVRGITGSGEERAAVASRKAAMLRLRRRYYLINTVNGKPQVYPDRIVEARVIAVSQTVIRVEVFGVETSIRSQDLSWGYVGDVRDLYFVGDTVQVRVVRVDGDAPENLSVRANIKSLTIDNTREKLMALKPQTNCMGTVTDVRQGVIFLSLVDGVRAISHKSFDHRRVGRGDHVLFVVTKIDEDTGTALGIVSRIVKRNI
ncbi:MAG: S1 RNA-binding domain-containing protein [Defluviitaleaceae bacterium]|nr:S1 RNA-binding domain-containing protein [Defluviitaleaceae bacterium]